MAAIYRSLIMKGIKTFAQVPDIQKEPVRAYLASWGLDVEGTPLEKRGE
ncbi:CD1375 family protein [Paenibacillus jamilae]|nr:CD1375 family protein [Paenibacillus jamilae]